MQAGYPLPKGLKNHASKQSRVTSITEFQPAQGHTGRVMARRSFGVVLIVALLGWTVNQPMGCEGQHSRAAVTVLAGASPAYQPEPSPTRHSCCPHERQAAQPSSPASQCPHSFSFPHDCCSLAGDLQTTAPTAILGDFAPSNVASGSVIAFTIEAPISQYSLSAEAQTFPIRSAPSLTILRL
jgi:hypothetical protein